MRLCLLIVIATLWCTPAFAQLLPKETSSSDILINEGVNALERNDLTEAKSKFLKAIELNPKNATAYIYLGIIDDRSGDFKSAEARFAAAVKADPRSSSAHNNHGASLLKLGRTKEAASEFVSSLNLDKNQPNALVNLAQLRLTSGSPADLTEALDLFDRAFKLRPDGETARALWLFLCDWENAKQQPITTDSTRDLLRSREIKFSRQRLELSWALHCWRMN